MHHEITTRWLIFRSHYHEFYLAGWLYEISVAHQVYIELLLNIVRDDVEVASCLLLVLDYEISNLLYEVIIVFDSPFCSLSC